VAARSFERFYAYLHTAAKRLAVAQRLAVLQQVVVSFDEEITSKSVVKPNFR
jgi:hypothetical protein